MAEDPEAEAPATLVGLFGDRAKAEDAIRDLEAAGFDATEIGFLTPTATDPRDEVGRKILSTTAEGAIAGGMVGGILAALVAGLIPGIGPIIGGGTLAALVATYTSAATGGVAGLVISAAGSEDERTDYSEFLKAGRSIVRVESLAERIPLAREILAKHGAEFPHIPSLVNPPLPQD